MTKKKCKLAVFDFFGVLCSDLFDEWVCSRGLAQEATQMRNDYVRPADCGEISFEEQCRGLGDKLGDHWTTIRDQLMSFAAIDRGVVEIVNDIKSRSSIAICTNAPRGLIEEIITYRSIRLPYDFKVVSSEFGKTKPEAAIYEYLLDAADVSAPESVMIDDRRDNIKGAEAVGMNGVHFTSTAKLKESLTEFEFSR